MLYSRSRPGPRCAAICEHLHETHWDFDDAEKIVVPGLALALASTFSYAACMDRDVVEGSYEKLLFDCQGCLAVVNDYTRPLKEIYEWIEKYSSNLITTWKATCRTFHISLLMDDCRLAVD